MIDPESIMILNQNGRYVFLEDNKERATAKRINIKGEIKWAIKVNIKNFKSQHFDDCPDDEMKLKILDLIFEEQNK